MKIKVTANCEKDIKALNKKYKSFKKDLAIFLIKLEENPYLGTPIGKDCYKIRMKISAKNTGKSGGARVITHVKIKKDTVYLFSIYDKSEKDNITDTQLKSWLKEVGND
jgi:mRNA-degrading endonuclease RelE of RelBE toxin-antitoxin system